MRVSTSWGRVGVAAWVKPTVLPSLQETSLRYRPRYFVCSVCISCLTVRVSKGSREDRESDVSRNRPCNKSKMIGQSPHVNLSTNRKRRRDYDIAFEDSHRLKILKTSDDESNTKEFKLDSACELRIEVGTKNEKVTLELKSGSAEVFGTELVKGKQYEFSAGTNVAVYTWQGCTVELIGKTNFNYVAKETPMAQYFNCHAAMERIREAAEKNGTRGPITMVVGPCNVGKSTLCRLLLNYAVRMGRRPIFVDLDVGQGRMAIPGAMGALLVERPASIGEGFSQQAPLVFHFGHETPISNVALYKLLVTRLAKVCSDRLQANKKTKASGIVINTCGSIKGDGYKLLIHAAQAFEVDTVLVLDQERLHYELVRDKPDFVKVLFLPKSAGVVRRYHAQRIEARDQAVRDYFYGSRAPLCPHSFEVKWSEVRIYKIGIPMLPASCLPFGMKVEDTLTKLVAVTPGPNLQHHVLSVSFADPLKDDVVQTDVAGFVCVTNVDVERQTFTVLSPQPRLLPNTVLLLSDIQFMDRH